MMIHADIIIIGDLMEQICPEIVYNTVPLVVKLDHEEGYSHIRHVPHRCIYIKLRTLGSHHVHFSQSGIYVSALK